VLGDVEETIYVVDEEDEEDDQVKVSLFGVVLIEKSNLTDRVI
jgi:hypothetical protein